MVVKQKNLIFPPHLMTPNANIDFLKLYLPRGGLPNVDKRGGSRRMWIKKFLNVNIINFENVDKPEGGRGRTMWIRLYS